MFMKKVVVSALVAAGMIGAIATPLPSVAASREIRVEVAPPPPRREAVPKARRGYVWAPGHWQWSQKRNRYAWVAGHWEKARRGYVYRAPEWVERDGRWHYRASRWDRDGDGIPNNRDATPDGKRSDRDRDGVPDSRDRRPNDPTRR